MNKNQISFIQNRSKEVIKLIGDTGFTHYFIGTNATAVHICYRYNIHSQDKLMFRPIGRLGRYESAGRDSFSYYVNRGFLFPKKLIEDFIMGDVTSPSKLKEIHVQDGEIVR